MALMGNIVANYWLILKIFRLISVFLALFSASTSIANVKSVEFRFACLVPSQKTLKLLNFMKKMNLNLFGLEAKDPLGKGDLIFLKNSKTHQSMLCQPYA